jgi:hypothetical protein
MQALKTVRHLVETQPDGDPAKVLSALVLALESEDVYPVSDLYRLDYDDFGLALQLLSEWRLDRYYPRKAAVLDVSRKPVQKGVDQPFGALALEGS